MIEEAIKVEDWKYFLVEAARHFGSDAEHGAVVIVEQDEQHGGRRAHVTFEKKDSGYEGLLYWRLDVS